MWDPWAAGGQPAPPGASPQAAGELLLRVWSTSCTPAALTLGAVGLVLTTSTPSSASMACRLTKEDTVHWYKQLPGEPPKRILYVSGKKPTFDDGTDEKKYQVRKHASEPHYSLTIDYVTQRDAGTYYCAYWYFEHITAVGNLVFGTGTKLIVSNKGNSKPENSEILQTKHKDQLLYVCLIENFYPEVIRVQWVDGADKEVTKNVVKGDVWKSTNDKYSVSTWLTLPVNMTNKNYFCKYDHESQENFKLPIQGIYSLWTHSLKGTGKAPS
uniref:Ig-like domain-containing protein n=1 Tax=Anser brachyrhynchus TaxID=132585 RepID=A0A8B9C650_9AVES